MVKNEHCDQLTNIVSKVYSAEICNLRNFDLNYIITIVILGYFDDITLQVN